MLALFFLVCGFLLNAAQDNASFKPIIATGTTTSKKYDKKYPYVWLCDQELESGQLFALFHSVRPQALSFLKEHFVSHFEKEFKAARTYDMHFNGLSHRLESAFNQHLVSTKDSERHAHIIRHNAVLFSIVHVLNDRYGYITSEPRPGTIFGKTHLYHSGYQRINNSIVTIGLHPQVTDGDIRMIDGSLAAGARPEHVAQVLLERVVQTRRAQRRAQRRHRQLAGSSSEGSGSRQVQSIEKKEQVAFVQLCLP